MGASLDPTDKYRFETEFEAVAYCNANGFDYVVELKGAEYSDKPYMCIKNTWVTGVKQVSE